MTRDETKVFLEAIIGLYPNFQYVGTPTVNAWFRKLEAVSLDDAEKALEAYFDKGEEFPPNLVKIVKLLPKKRSNVGAWQYEQDQYGFEFVVKELENGTILRRSVRKIDEDTYEDKDGYRWAIV